MPYHFARHITKAVLLGALLLVSACQTAAVQRSAERTDDAKRVETVRAEHDRLRGNLVAAYARSDVDAMMSFYDPKAAYAGTLQTPWLEGELAIRGLWTRYFAAYPTHRLVFHDPVVQVYGPTSVETGFVGMFMTPPNGAEILTDIRYSITRVETKDGWKIVNMNMNRRVER